MNLENFNSRISKAKTKYQKKSKQQIEEQENRMNDHRKEMNEYGEFMKTVILKPLEEIQNELEQNGHKCDLSNGLPQGGLSLYISPESLNTNNTIVEISFSRGSTNERITITGLPKSVRYGSFSEKDTLFHDDVFGNDITSEKIENYIAQLIERAYDIWE